jgi:CheY-like chemotaxis protein
VALEAGGAIVGGLVDAAAFPELRGRETAAAIRDTLDAECAVVFVAPPEGDIRLIAWSGYGQDADIQAALDAGFDDHITKPPDLDRLEQILSRP